MIFLETVRSYCVANSYLVCDFFNEVRIFDLLEFNLLHRIRDTRLKYFHCVDSKILGFGIVSYDIASGQIEFDSKNEKFVQFVSEPFVFYGDNDSFDASIKLNIKTLEKEDFSFNGSPVEFTKDLLICRNGQLLQVFDREKLIWQHDVSEIGGVKSHFVFGSQKGEIVDVILFQDIIFLLNGNSLQWLRPSTGEIINELSADKPWGFHGLQLIPYEDKILFLPKGGTAFRIYDVNSNSMSDFVKIKIPDGQPKDLDFVASGWKIENDKLWFVSNREIRFAAAIDPLSGSSFEFVPVATNGIIESPQFSPNKIFIRDSENVLHMFDR